jgi:putative ATP-grasp target RiPP
MARDITIIDLPTQGAELSDDELAGIAGGMPPCGCGSSKTIIIAGDVTDSDRDF